MQATREPRHRLRRCGDCRGGEHSIELRTWRTAFLLLVRRQCTCSCDCTYGRVRIEEPRFDQRHAA
jgi:hypothetical protein